MYKDAAFVTSLLEIVRVYGEVRLFFSPFFAPGDERDFHGSIKTTGEAVA